MLFFGTEEIQPGLFINTYFCEDTQRIFHEYVQDVAPVVDFNLDMQKDNTSFKAMGDSFSFANIPAALIQKWINEEGFNFYKAPMEDVLKKLNSSDYKNLRTIDKTL